MTIRIVPGVVLASCFVLAQAAGAASLGQPGGSDTAGVAANGRTASPTYTKILRTQFKYDIGASAKLGTGTIPLTPLFINMNCTNSAGCGLDADINISWEPAIVGPGSDLLYLCVQVDTSSPVCRYEGVSGSWYASALIDVFTPVTFGTHAVKVTGSVVFSPGWYRSQSVARYTLYAP